MNFSTSFHFSRKKNRRYPCTEPGCNKVYMTRGGRSKHQRKDHCTTPSAPGPVDPVAPGSGASSSNTPGPSVPQQGILNQSMGPGPVLTSTFTTESGSIYQWSQNVGLVFDSGMVLGRPNLESTRAEPESDQSETLESESTGASDDYDDLDYDGQ